MARQPRWYVIQVQTGREQMMCQLIQRVCNEADVMRPLDDHLVDEVFTPSYKTRHKFHGEWQDVTKLLLPGYVIAVTSHPEELHALLRTVPDFTRVLTVGETFVPLLDEERQWMDEFTTKGDRVVEMSMAVMEGDRFVVTEGPLKGREGMVTRVNRHKCLATIEMHIGNVRVQTTVGLGIVPGEDSKAEGGTGFGYDAPPEDFE